MVSSAGRFAPEKVTPVLGGLLSLPERGEDKSRTAGNRTATVQPIALPAHSPNCTRPNLNYEVGLSGLVEKQGIWQSVKEGRERSSFKTRADPAMVVWQGSAVPVKSWSWL